MMTTLNKNTCTGHSRNIPALRFPEFNDEWGTEKLGKLATINPSNKDLPNKFIYIDLESVVSGELTKEDVVYKIDAPSRAQRILEKEDVLFQMVRPYQKNNLYFERDGVYIASTGYAQIRTKQYPKYLYQYIHFQKFVDKVIERCTGTSYPAINSTDLSNICISYPSLSEQQKIADFLTAADSKLTQIKQKKKLLEQYKKGVMQKIFSQEIRFRDEQGKEFQKWEVKKLGEIFSIFNGYAFSSGDTKKEGVLWVKIADVGIQEIKNDNLSFLPSEYIEKHRNFVLKKGDYVLALTRPILNGKLKIARINEVFNNSLLNQRVGKIVTENNSTFVYYLLQLTWLIKEIENNIAGSDPPNLSPKEIDNIEVDVPKIPEQIKIANFLSAIDEKINHCNTQILKMEQWKKGLLQQMFC